MEDKIKKLFDYQKFEKNSKLDNIITSVEDFSCETIFDEELAFVSGGSGNSSINTAQVYQAIQNAYDKGVLTNSGFLTYGAYRIYYSVNNNLVSYQVKYANDDGFVISGTYTLKAKSNTGVNV